MPALAQLLSPSAPPAGASPSGGPSGTPAPAAPGAFAAALAALAPVAQHRTGPTPSPAAATGIPVPGTPFTPVPGGSRPTGEGQKPHGKADDQQEEAIPQDAAVPSAVLPLVLPAQPLMPAAQAAPATRDVQSGAASIAAAAIPGTPAALPSSGEGPTVQAPAVLAQQAASAGIPAVLLPPLAAAAAGGARPGAGIQIPARPVPAAAGAQPAGPNAVGGRQQYTTAVQPPAPAATPAFAAAVAAVQPKAQKGQQARDAPTAPDAVVLPTAPQTPAPAQAAGPTTALAPAQPAPAPFAAQLAKPVFTIATAPHGEHIMTVKVTPEDLGPVTVQAHIGSDGVKVQLFAPTDAGRAAVQAAMPELRQNLADAGLNASLDLSSRSQPQAGGGQQGSGGQQQARPGAAVSTEPAQSTWTAAPVLPAGTDTRLDILA